MIPNSKSLGLYILVYTKMKVYVYLFICALLHVVGGENVTIDHSTSLQQIKKYSTKWQEVNILGTKFTTAETINRSVHGYDDTAWLFLSDCIKGFPDKVLFLCNNDDYTSLMIEMSTKLQGKVIIYDKLQDINFNKLDQEIDDNLLYLIFMNYTHHPISQLTSYIRSQQIKGEILLVTDSTVQTIKQDWIESTYYQIFLATPTKSGYELYEKCAYCNNGHHAMVKINSWSSNIGFTRTLTFGKSFKGRFNGRNLKVALNDLDFKGTLSTTAAKLMSSEYDMLLDVAELLNFSITIVTPEDREYGRYKDNTWTGLIGMVHDMKADIAIGVLSISYQRFSVVNPTAVIGMEEIGIISAKPNREPRWQSIYECFTAGLWLLTALSVFLVGFSLYIIYHYMEPENPLSFIRALYMPSVVLFTEPFSVHKPNSYTIFVLSLWLLMSTTILSFYIGSLTSHILTPPFSEKTIDSLEDLIRSGRKWMAEEGSIQALCLLDSNTELINKYVPLTTSLDLFDKFTLILEHPHELTDVYPTSLTIMEAIHYYLDPQGLNPIYTGKDILISYPDSWMVNKNCPFQKDLTLTIMRVQEVGFQKYYQRKMFFQARQEILGFCSKFGYKRPNINITTSHFIKMLSVLSFGYLFSLIVFLFERFILSRIFSFGSSQKRI